jgi:hypothetical protein
VAAPHVELLYIEGCPNWEIVAVRLSIALKVTGHADVHVHLCRIDSFEDATQAGFTGSPMIRIDGFDPFGRPEQQSAYACRVFYDGDDVVNGPSIVQLLDAIVGATA